MAESGLRTERGTSTRKRPARWRPAAGIVVFFVAMLPALAVTFIVALATDPGCDPFDPQTNASCGTGWSDALGFTTFVVACADAALVAAIVGGVEFRRRSLRLYRTACFASTLALAIAIVVRLVTQT